MTQICSIHQKNVIEVCLHPECPNRKLCHICIRKHPASHDPEIRDIYSLAEDARWLENLETLRDKLAQETKLLISEARRKAEIKIRIKNVFQNIREEITKKEFLILQELDENEEIESENTLLQLGENLESIQELNFRNSDYFQRVAIGLNFEDSEKQKTEVLLEEVRKSLDVDRPDENKLALFQSEFNEVIQSIHFTDFLLSKSRKSFICNEEILTKLQALNPQGKKSSLHLANRRLLENVEVALDWKACGPKLRFSENIEIYFCKGNCKEFFHSNNIWGSNPYTCDSDKCFCLHHNGFDGSSPGCFLIEYTEGRDSYEATKQNGVSSKSWKAYPRSFNILSRINVKAFQLLKNLDK